jgi:hypothetical protein
LNAQGNYEDYTDEDRVNIFFDDFLDNGNKWLKGANEEYSDKIIDGNYYLEDLKEPNGSWSFKDIIIDTDKDFEIETAIRSVIGKSYSSSSLIWGMRPSVPQYYQYSFDRDGNYKIFKYSGNMSYLNAFTYYKEGNIEGLVNKTDYNILTVRKVKDSYYFFLNHTMIHTMDFNSLFGDLIGFSVSQLSTINVDYLRVAYLYKETPRTQQLRQRRHP